jgi:hypothetical protein
VDGEEQQVEGESQRHGERDRAAPCRAFGRKHPAEHRRRDQVAVAHHRRAERGALKARQPRRGSSRVERVVRSLQEIGDDQRGVGERHRHDPHGQPPTRCDRTDQ